MLYGPGCTSPQAEAPAQPEPQDHAAPEDGLFVDRAEELGLGFVHANGMTGAYYMVEIMGAGGALFDYDLDGDLDAYLVQGSTLDGAQDPGLRDRLFRNDLVETGRLAFSEVTEVAGLQSTGYGMGVTIGDFTNDGYPDLYVTNFGPNRMFRNNGDGTFADVTAAAGTDDERWSTTATFFDYDRDGWLDLYVGNYVNYTLATHKTCYTTAGAVDYCGPLSYNPYPNRLFHNRGDGTFEEVTAAAQIDTEAGGALGVVASDFNGDGWPDLYVANDARANQLWINQQNGRFTDEALVSGTAFNEFGKAQGSMGIAVADYDNDGDEDLFMTHLNEETNTLYRNDGTGLFEDYTFEAELGLPSRGFTGFGTAWFDYDNDGLLDLLVVNGEIQIAEGSDQTDTIFSLAQTNQLFRNRGGGRFEEVTATAGTVFERSEVSRGAAFGDVDNDGDTDVLITNNNGPARLLVNQAGSRNAWLGLRLISQSGGRDEVGTRVGCTLASGLTLWRQVRTDGSYASAHDPRLLFGLNTSSQPCAIQVQWPDGTREQWSKDAFSLNRYYTLEKGSGRAVGGSG